MQTLQFEWKSIGSESITDVTGVTPTSTEPRLSTVRRSKRTISTRWTRSKPPVPSMAPSTSTSVKSPNLWRCWRMMDSNLRSLNIGTKIKRKFIVTLMAKLFITVQNGLYRFQSPNLVISLSFLVFFKE